MRYFWNAAQVTDSPTPTAGTFREDLARTVLSVRARARAREKTIPGIA